MDILKENLVGIETINLGFRVRDLKVNNSKIYLLEYSTPVKIYMLEKVKDFFKIIFSMFF